ncbi:hypothetical protein K504DRAFT_462018 [Pleomassaria siparia CBS 279.74]|uniref:Uncharacterized protein n=1 Tax=Pleomassaria siparia CBS 279.74 TaxID=1314801 RepID=A0A6G1KL25_9PLEO|nr:hypothetical protein K504DRAFT_462018 [Pleomassaria siparia CBS 279.74]
MYDGRAERPGELDRPPYLLYVRGYEYDARPPTISYQCINIITAKSSYECKHTPIIHQSHVTRHMSHVTRHPSPVTRHT